MKYQWVKLPRTHLPEGKGIMGAWAKQSIDILYRSGIPFELRTTVVKGIHTVEDMTRIAKWISPSKAYYLQPYVVSEHIIAPNGLSSFSDEELEEMLSTVRTYCPSAALRK